MPKPSPVVDILRPIIANTALLQLKTHQYHQNVKGYNFAALHELVLDVEYKALVEAVDTIGERIKHLFGNVPTTDEYPEFGDIKSSVIGATEIEVIKDLATDNFNLAQQCIQGADDAQEYKDAATVDLLGLRQLYHEDVVWRLTSMLPDGDRDDFIDELQASVEEEDDDDDQEPPERRLRIKA